MTESLLPFFIATLALNLTPGPDMLYVSTRSVMQGRRAGIVSALGIAAGALVHTALIASGLATLLNAVPLAYDIVRYAGAAYLVWLGIQTWRTRDGLTAPSLQRASEWTLFRQGLITNLLNPKVALFFLAFLPQFAHPEAGSIAVQIILLGCLFNVSGTLVNVAVACLAASTARRWLANPRAQRALQWGSGSVFIALGLRLALPDRR
jgi:RhtB (resistance to homoserine/threonine) family protein